LNSGFRAALVTAGGGSGALHALLATPGASRFVTEAHVPYSPEALERFLGEKPEHSVSPAIAIKLAEAAFKFQSSNLEFLSIGCTAALQTDRGRRGSDRAFICVKTAGTEKLYALHLSKTSRAEQENLLSEWILILIAQTVGAERGLMLPGSFNPVHQGHLNLLKAAEKITGLSGVFELSCANVDKPALEEADCLRRAAAIRDIPVALTQAPRFMQKAELFPETTFVLGYDTAERLVRYADPDEWTIFRRLETSFLVAGRQLQCGAECFQNPKNADALPSSRFLSLENLELPAGFESLFESIPESEFREDISSTALRC
jgi:nicotinic acid mononucleotide adenylyltransferase/nicotinamide mononucleotide (NMN) deamidase PncC